MVDFDGDARAERVYRASRSVVGKGGSPEREDGILAHWRAARARAFAIILEGGERAALQAFPDRATDALPYYEQLFGLAHAPGETTEQRQAEVAARYTLEVRSAVRDLVLGLREIDERFSITETDPDRSTSTIYGRAFEDLEGAEPYSTGARDSTKWPNYSSEFVADVVLELGDGVLPNTEERRAIARARAYLHAVLPGHNDFRITTHRGFHLDVSRLDITSLGEEEA